VTVSAAPAAADAVAANPAWYHTIELAPGVVTPGRVDLRRTAPRILPASLDGLRALDVGTFDGFWAFELERRGAEVVALDAPSAGANDWPPLNRPRLERMTELAGVELGHGFRLAAAALGSAARRVECNLYDLDPEAIGGPVDIAIVGSILVHLRDPVRGLERIRDALAPGGRAILLEPVSLRETVLAPRRPIARFQAFHTDFNWWYPNRAALKVWLLAAGFADVRRTGLHRPPAHRRGRQWLASLEARRT
jgi:SAM-dependent methyltransferase